MNNFTISRTLKAPRCLVFGCWTQPEHFEQWFSPAGCENKLLHADVRPGGYFQQQTTGPDGAVIYNRFDFREINPIDSLVFVVSFCDADGAPAKHPVWPNWPDRLLTTVTFEDEGKATKVSVLWEPLEASQEQTEFFVQHRDDSYAGWSETFDKIGKTVEGLHTVALQEDL